MLKVVLAAILFLAPALPKHKARSYSKTIVKEARRRSVPPMLVVAVIHHETGGTWRTRLRSRTNDYGLMQIHVSSRVHQRYIGKEHLLYKPAVNIYWGTKFLWISRWWHRRNCAHRKPHQWWAHYNWGFRVLRNRQYERGVLRILRRLRRRFRRPAPGTGAISSVTVAPDAAATVTSRSSGRMRFKRPLPLSGRTRTTRRSGATRGEAPSSASCTLTSVISGSITPTTVRTMERRMNDRFQ